MLLERLIHECVSSLPHRVWEIMLAIGMLDPQESGMPVQFKNRAGRLGNAIDTLGTKV